MLSSISVEQQACVDALLQGHNVQVQAAAGAGKSTTFYHAAQAWLAAYPDSHVVQLCFNVVLRTEAEKKITALGLQDQVHCFTVHALATHMYETRVSDSLTLYLSASRHAVQPQGLTFGLCLLDEAQDLNADHIQVINRLQSLMAAPMRYMVVGDTRQEIYAHARGQDAASSTVMENPAQHLNNNGHSWQACTLYTSYRLTPAVCAFLNNVMRDSTQTAIIAGNKTDDNVRPRYIIGNRDSDDIGHVIQQLLTKYKPGDIMILAPSVGTPRHRCHRLAKHLNEQTRVPIYSTHKQRTEVNTEMLQNKIFLSTFHQSKGYERKCVVVLGVDAEEWALNDSPQQDGRPLVHNSLHVALTRPREQLIIFQHFQCATYPTIQLDTVSQWVDIDIMHTPIPRAIKIAKPKQRFIEDFRLISFQPRTTLEAVVHSLPLPTGQKMDVPHAQVPSPATLVTLENDMVEDVADYFPEAILSWIEHRYTNKASLMENKLRHVTIPVRFNAYMTTRHPTAMHWLVWSILHNTLVQHEFPHELHQLQHLNWIHDRELLYITHCMQNMEAVIPRTRGFWHETCCRELNKTIVKSYARFVVWDEAGRATPWQFVFADLYSEINILYAIIQLWVFQCPQVVIYCVPYGIVYVVQNPGDHVLQELVQVMIHAKQ